MTGIASASQKRHGEFNSVEGKGILVTGGTTGIGRATARLLASFGANVLIFGRHDRELADALADLREVSPNVTGLTADVAVAEDIARVFREVDARLPQLDVLINNAAIAAQGIEEGGYSEWEYIVKTNLLGYLACTHAALERMKPGNSGHIVNVGSMSADVRESGSSIYVATKSAIQGFSEALRKEVNKSGIKVSLIEPGSVGTDMQPDDVPTQRRKEAAGEMLMAEDIAACIYYCLTQPSRCDVVSVQIRPHLQEI